MKVVISEPLCDALNVLVREQKRDWVTYDYLAKNADEFLERVKDAEIVASYFTKFDKELIDKCPKLKYIVVGAVGVDSSVDLKVAKERGIIVSNCPGYNSVAVAEAAVGLAVAVNRSLVVMQGLMQEGIWANDSYRKYRRSTISGKKIGLIGYGNIGKKIYELLSSWSSEFLIANSKSTNEEIDLVVSKSDVLIVCCSLNEKTKNLVSRERINMMKDTTVVINVSRGAVIDEDALYEALQAGNVAGAGLDVFIDEPTREDRLPENIKRFTGLKNVVCLPHIAGSPDESGEVLAKMIIENIDSCISSSPLHVVRES